VGDEEIKAIEQSAPRVRWLARIVLLWATLILFRLVQLQVVRHNDFRHLAQQQQEHIIEVRPPRGAILDRNGQRLAMSLPVESIYVNPLLIPNIDVAADLMAPILNLDRSRLDADLHECVQKHRGFLWIKRKAPEEEADRLRNLHVDWIQFVTESRRFYPYGTLAAHVVGSVDSDGKGLGGVERKLNDVLGGKPGKLLVTEDVRQRGFESEQYGAPAQPGHDVHLTIDARIQYIAEEMLRDTVVAHHCHTGSAVVMDPRTGKILALASYPPYDPNQPVRNEFERKARFNQAVSVPFEPGSVFKVVTLSAALETTNLRPESIIPTGHGAMTFFGRVVHDSHNGPAAMSMEDVLVHSSNIGAINIGIRVGKEHLYEYIHRFGFGQRTGISLPGESPGLVFKPEHWRPSSIASVPMGHELLVTTLQLARACAVIANGGYLVKPQLLEDAPVQSKQILRPQTVMTMRHMMEQVVLRGTGRNARLIGYSAAGKTGTAQIVDLQTHHYTHFYNASFMGFSPVANPSLVVAVTANGAAGTSGFGAEVSAPVFKEVMTASLRFLEVPRDLPDDALPVPDDGKNETNDLAIADLSDPTLLVPPEEAAGDSDGDQQGIFVPAANQVSGPQAPNFIGMTARAVAELSAQTGIPVESIGTGLVRQQYPLPGAVLPAGERVRLRFAR